MAGSTHDIGLTLPRALVVSACVVALGLALLWVIRDMPRPPEHDVIFGGDVMLGREVQQWREIGADPLRGVAPLLRRAGQVIVNLESPLTTATVAGNKEIVLKADPDAVAVLTAAGVTAVCAANNHIFDYGLTGFEETAATLSEAGIALTGAGRNVEEATTPLNFSLEDGTVRIVNFSKYSRSDVPAATATSFGQAFYGSREFEQRIREAARESDLVVVALHFGREYWLGPDGEQQNYARLAIDYGADVVIGHHPHVTQPVEQYRGGVIFYSLGNLVFDQETPPRDRSFLVALDVTPESLVFTLYPYTITRGEVELMEDRAGQAFLSGIARLSTPGLLSIDGGQGQVVFDRTSSLSE